MNKRMRTTQQGIALFVSLIALVVITLSAISLVRVVDTSNIILGNMSFKSDTINASDVLIEQARSWIGTQSQVTLNNDGASGSGYYASADTSTGVNDSTTDFLGTATSTTSDNVNWDGLCNNCGSVVAHYSNGGTMINVNGMPAAYLIIRLCDQAGVTDFINHCRGAVTGSTDSTNIYYRIITRVSGPRNTYSYIEAVVRNNQRVSWREMASL